MWRGIEMVELTILGECPDGNLRGAWEVLMMQMERLGWNRVRLIQVRELQPEQLSLGGMKP